MNWLLFKFDFLGISEFRQQIKTFRLKYVFLAGKIIRTARYAIGEPLTKLCASAILSLGQKKPNSTQKTNNPQKQGK